MLYPFSMHLFTKSFRKVSCQRVSQNSFDAEDELKEGIPRSKLHLCLVVLGCTLMGFLGGCVFTGLVQPSCSFGSSMSTPSILKSSCL